MKKALVILFVSIFAMSCSSEDDNENISTETILIKKINYSNQNSADVSEVKYTYDGTKLVSATIDNSTTLSYIYEGNLITRINTYSAGNVLTNYFVFEYDNNRLIRSRHIIPVANQGFRSEFTYNPDNTISVSLFSGGVATQNTADGTGKYFMAENGEIAKYEEYQSLGTVTRIYSYDNKNNPYKNITGFDKLLNQPGKYHNVTDELSLDAAGSVIASESHTYIYNERDFPQSAVRTQNNTETIIVYSYE